MQVPEFNLTVGQSSSSLGVFADPILQPHITPLCAGEMLAIPTRVITTKKFATSVSILCSAVAF